MMMRRRMLLAALLGSGGSLFPAIIVAADNTENLNNYAIAKYFLEKYPEGAGEIPITEDVTISGTNYCDGKVTGLIYASPNDGVVAFRTKTGDDNLYALRVFTKAGAGTYIGSTHEWFYD